MDKLSFFFSINFSRNYISLSIILCSLKSIRYISISIRTIFPIYFRLRIINKGVKTVLLTGKKGKTLMCLLFPFYLQMWEEKCSKIRNEGSLALYIGQEFRRKKSKVFHLKPWPNLKIEKHVFHTECTRKSIWRRPFRGKLLSILRLCSSMRKMPQI